MFLLVNFHISSNRFLIKYEMYYVKIHIRHNIYNIFIHCQRRTYGKFRTRHLETIWPTGVLRIGHLA